METKFRGDFGENKNGVPSQSSGAYVKKGHSFACTLKPRPTQLFVQDQQKRLLAPSSSFAFFFFPISSDHHPHLILPPFFLVLGNRKKNRVVT
jgi:hypothetical protein